MAPSPASLAAYLLSARNARPASVSEAGSRRAEDMSCALAPVGVFDSGVGGLTVARAIIDQLPDEDIIYVGDTGNGPYGPLTIPESARTRWPSATTWSTAASRRW